MTAVATCLASTPSPWASAVAGQMFAFIVWASAGAIAALLVLTLRRSPLRFGVETAGWLTAMGVCAVGTFLIGGAVVGGIGYPEGAIGLAVIAPHLVFAAWAVRQLWLVVEPWLTPRPTPSFASAVGVDGQQLDSPSPPITSQLVDEIFRETHEDADSEYLIPDPWRVGCALFACAMLVAAWIHVPDAIRHSDAVAQIKIREDARMLYLYLRHDLPSSSLTDGPVSAVLTPADIETLTIGGSYGVFLRRMYADDIATPSDFHIVNLDPATGQFDIEFRPSTPTAPPGILRFRFHGPHPD